MNIKLSDAFRGRYALPIGGPCPVLFFIAHENDKRKESERAKNLPPPEEKNEFCNNHFTCVVSCNCCSIETE